MTTDTKDTNAQTSIEEMLNTLRDEGFHEVLKKDFSQPHVNIDKEGEETASLHVYWNPEYFMLAKVEEHYVDYIWVFGDTDNIIGNATMYYNIKPFDIDDFIGKHAASGHLRDDIWVGTNNMMEGFRATLNRLKEQGEFVKWIERPCMWLHHYLADGSFDELEKELIVQLPEEVREIVNIEIDETGDSNVRYKD